LVLFLPYEIIPIMKFEIIEKDWCKRRAPTKNTITPLSVSIPEYVQEHNYFCDMFVTYSGKL